MNENNWKQKQLKDLELIKQDLLKQREEIKRLKSIIEEIKIPFILHFLPQKYIDMYIKEKIKIKMNENSF